MNAESTLTSKGQTTIPKDIRDRLRMKTGDRMTFTLMADGTVLLRIKNRG
jgi:antitoxin PrlF